jgi:hypothetical protein
VEVDYFKNKKCIFIIFLSPRPLILFFTVLYRYL